MILADDSLLAQDTNQLMPQSSNVLQLVPVPGHVLNSFLSFLPATHKNNTEGMTLFIIEI
jgi:hypothetical protein